MNRNYQTAEQMGLTAASDIDKWAETRETSLPVAIAIHAISDPANGNPGGRTAEQIWEAPTDAEFDHVKMATQEYVEQGDFEAEETYLWGEESFTL